MSQAQTQHQAIDWSFQSMSTLGRDFSRKVLAKKNGNPVAWRLVRQSGEDTFISYPTWWKYATEEELNEAFCRLAEGVERT